MLAVIRHGDRTPKQKMKMKVTQVRGNFTAAWACTMPLTALPCRNSLFVHTGWCVAKPRWRYRTGLWICTFDSSQSGEAIGICEAHSKALRNRIMGLLKQMDTMPGANSQSLLCLGNRC